MRGDPAGGVARAAAGGAGVQALEGRAGDDPLPRRAPAEAGVPFINRLDNETDRQWRTARREGRREARSVLAADAFVKLIRPAGEPADGNSKPPPKSQS